MNDSILNNTTAYLVIGDQHSIRQPVTATYLNKVTNSVIALDGGKHSRGTAGEAAAETHYGSFKVTVGPTVTGMTGLNNTTSSPLISQLTDVVRQADIYDLVAWDSHHGGTIASSIISKLSTGSITIGSTTVALGSTVSGLDGLSSITTGLVKLSNSLDHNASINGLELVAGDAGIAVNTYHNGSIRAMEFASTGEASFFKPATVYTGIGVYNPDAGESFSIFAGGSAGGPATIAASHGMEFPSVVNFDALVTHTGDITVNGGSFVILPNLGATNNFSVQTSALFSSASFSDQVFIGSYCNMTALYLDTPDGAVGITPNDEGVGRVGIRLQTFNTVVSNAIDISPEGNVEVWGTLRGLTGAQIDQNLEVLGDFHTQGSGSFTGGLTAVTASIDTSSTQVATTEYVQAQPFHFVTADSTPTRMTGGTHLAFVGASFTQIICHKTGWYTLRGFGQAGSFVGGTTNSNSHDSGTWTISDYPLLLTVHGGALLITTSDGLVRLTDGGTYDISTTGTGWNYTMSYMGA